MMAAAGCGQQEEPAEQAAQTPLSDPTIGENQEAYQAVLQTAVVEYDWLDPATGESVPRCKK